MKDLEENRDLPKYLEKEELKHFLNSAKEYGLDQDYYIFLLLSYTGIRVGELCALKWKDIDMNEQTIQISKTYYNPTNNRKKYTLLPPKTASAARSIDIDITVVNELKKHKIKQMEIIMKYREKYHNQDFVFAIEDSNVPGYPYYTKKVGDRMKRLLKIANLSSELTPHSLRHTHTSLLAEADVSLPQIMERLGHKDEATTRNVYLHVTKERKKEASQKFQKLMENL